MGARLLAAVASLAVAFSGAVLLVPPTSAAPVVVRAAAPPIVHMSGNLTKRPSSPPPGTPEGRKLASAKVTTTPGDDRARATVVLKAAPKSSQNAQLWVVLGEMTGSVCDAWIEYSTPTVGAPAVGWSRSGKTYTLNSTAESVYDSYDCAFATLTPLDSIAPEHDRLEGSLAPIYAKPKLKVRNAKLLGSKKLKLLRGEWTTIDVNVRNMGTHQTGKVVVKGKGKGLKVKKGVTPHPIYPGNTTAVPVKVKLAKKGKAKLKLIATGPGAGKATKKVTIQPAKAPKRIRNGKYRSKDKRVTFRVKKGKITGFRAQAWTSCGGYPDFPTYSWATYSIPKKKIPRSGIVQIVEKGKSPAYTASLNGRATGAKVKAKFAYNGPNRCSASVSFTAKRIG